MTNKKQKSISLKSGFTLIEIAVVIAIIGIIIAITIPALSNAKSNSQNRAEDGTAKTLNEAIIRAILKGKNGITSMADWNSTYGNDPTNALNFLITNGYLTEK